VLSHDQETSNIPFIFLTAKADKSDFRAGMDLGADDYITKPFDSLHLLKVIELRLRKNRKLKSFADEIEPGSAFINDDKNVFAFKKLIENRPTRLIKKRELLFMEGQTPNDLYYIESGKIKTYKINYDGKELITGIYKEGQFIGFVPLLEEKPYHESAEVMEDTQLTIIPKSDFLSLIYSNKGIAKKFIKILSNNLDDTESRLLDIAYKSVRQRVATILLNLNEELPSKDSTVRLARKDIANLVGTATESLNRTLADFKDEGLIEILSEGLHILNKQKLEKVIR
jgi:CRP-like cAMP-binding protein